MPPPGVCLNILEARSKQNGNGGSKNPEKFLQQDYEQLKQYCNIRGLRYIDERFPPDRNSIGAGILSPSDLDRVVWLRPAVSSAASTVSCDCPNPGLESVQHFRTSRLLNRFVPLGAAG